MDRALLTLFVCSGFAGLVYQSIWSHYLGLTLGHAAYAQTLVLAIFMGGMAAGAGLVARYGGRWRRLILVYAGVEALIGVAALLFHPLFVAYGAFSLDTVYPALGSGGAVRAWQWGSAALLIAPQSLLLGMTFPLMSGGYLRVAPRADGEALGGLYFSNSIGAAFGALFATFALLPWLGMPGTIMVAGVVNLAVAAASWVVARRLDGAGTGDAAPLPAAAPVRAPAAGRGDGVAVPAAQDGSARGFGTAMLVAAAITGATSFVYEIGWVRMLNQALGTTVHSFELMLAAFILGLAFGGYWIRRRAHAIADVVAYAGHAQVLMGVAALVSLPLFAQSFRWVGALMQVVPRTDGGYVIYSLGSAAIAMAVMMPAAFFAGMTLPLFTVALLRRGHGEASIGRIYAANTLGAIIGVVLAVHVLIPAIGLHLSVALAALADIVLGLVLLRRLADDVSPRAYFTALVGSAAVLVVCVLVGRPGPAALTSGVFRTGVTAVPGLQQVDYLRDGKTATTAVYRQSGSMTIATNGKPDASLAFPGYPPTDDEMTMIMAAALPLGLHPEPERIAVIGWGSGLTTHSLLGSPVPRIVDTVEIEYAMVEGASLFRPRVERAYADPRTRLHVDDARTFFSSGHREYDVIVSEPSNPWVSGVASLFTRQFYAFLDRHLADDGLLVQWIQAYELNDPLLATMLAALLAEFPHVDAYLTNQGDLLLVASRRPLPAMRMPSEPGSAFAGELTRIGMDRVEAFDARRLGGRAFLDTLVRVAGAVPHDDFYPTVSLHAPRARFKREMPTRLFDLAQAGLPVLEMTDGRRPPPLSAGVDTRRSGLVEMRAAAAQVHAALAAAARIDGDTTPLLEDLGALRALSAVRVAPDRLPAWLEAVGTAAESSIGVLPAEDHSGVWIAPAWIDPDAQPSTVRAVMAAYAAAASRDPTAMRRDGLAALDELDAVDPRAGLLVREHMLVIAILGGAAQSADGGVQVEREHGRRVPLRGGSRYGAVRSYLLAWGDR